ncbi:hypothetical protein, partial [Streptomyces sp. NPDC057403]|uniref:hypothetical protein n=1 Tax=Streptomyces sp. NPDC057403 TaxID=3346119 RepID=UPI00367B07B5
PLFRFPRRPHKQANPQVIPAQAAVQSHWLHTATTRPVPSRKPNLFDQQTVTLWYLIVRQSVTEAT